MFQVQAQLMRGSISFLDIHEIHHPIQLARPMWTNGSGLWLGLVVCWSVSLIANALLSVSGIISGIVLVVAEMCFIVMLACFNQVKGIAVI